MPYCLVSLDPSYSTVVVTPAKISPPLLDRSQVLLEDPSGGWVPFDRNRVS
jgi:hypothetical protein